MRKWYVPLTIAGIGGLGIFLSSESGKELLRWVRRNLRVSSEDLLEWNETAEAELERIRAALGAVADALQPRQELGR
jgi:hypothetical protein